MIPWVPKTTLLIDSEEEDPTQTKWTYISSAFWLEAKKPKKRPRETCGLPSYKKQLWPIDLVFKHKEQAIKVVSKLEYEKLQPKFYFSSLIRVKLVMVVPGGILSTLESNKGELLFLHTTWPFIFFTRLNFLFLYGQLKAWVHFLVGIEKTMFNFFWMSFILGHARVTFFLLFFSWPKNSF